MAFIYSSMQWLYKQSIIQTTGCFNVPDMKIFKCEKYTVVSYKRLDFIDQTELLV